MDIVATSLEGTKQPPLIPTEWAIQQLKAHWPALEIEQVLPERAREMVAFKGKMPEVGTISIRMLTADPQDPESAKRLTLAFHRAQAIAKIENAFAIPTLQAGSVGGCLVIVSAWKEGEPLDQYLKREKISFESALAMVDCLAQAFEIYHEAGWTHGYLRADSVLVTGPNEVTLSGHGILDIVTGYIPEPLDPNRLYVAPERNGRETDPAEIVEDVYNVGVVSYEIFTSEQPSGQFMKMPSQVTSAGTWLDDVIFRAIHSQADKRIANLTEFRREMAAQAVRLMDLSKKEKKEDSTNRVSKEASGSMAMMRKPFYGFLTFAIIMVSLAIWLGQTMYENREQVQLSTQQAVGLMTELMTSLAEDEEGLDAKAIAEELSKAGPEVQHEALLEKVEEMRKAGKHEEAMELTQKMLDLNSGVEDPAVDAMKDLLADLGESLETQKTLQREADQALANSDLMAEETALEKLFEESPEDPALKRRLSQIPKYFTPTWEHVEKEMKHWNAGQKDWHITIHRDATGLEVDLSGHANVHWVDGIVNLPIDRLDLRHTSVQSLSSLVDMELKALWCDHTPVQSIVGLENQPLEIFSMTRTKVADFRPIEKFAFVRTLRVDPQSKIPNKFEIPFAGKAWENSLGQRYLPLSDTSTLIESREITEFDYTHFILAEKANELVKGAAGELEKNATLKPMLVTFPEALAFCDWITKHEQQAGYLPTGGAYRLPEGTELEQLKIQLKGVAVEDGAQSALGGTIQPVSEGPCLRGFFDVHDNAPEWTFDFRDVQLYRLRGDLPKGISPDTKRGIRVVLDLREARYKKKETVTAVPSDDSEE